MKYSRTMKSPVCYLPPVGERAETFSQYSVEKFIAEAPWEQRTSARHEAFWSSLDQPYTYGKEPGRRTYHPSPFPEFMRPMKVVIDSLADRDMQLCFLNRYDDQFQHLGWHADDSPEQDDDAPIIVVSFGAERELWVRENGKSGEEAIEKRKLENGSILVMLPGMQQTHQHRIPKHDRPCGPRVSLTWRALK